MKSEFRLWPEEEAFVQAQAARRADGLEPEAIPVELQNWQERAEDEVRRLIEEQKRELLAKWKDAVLRWENYLAERQVYQDEFYSGRKYELSSEEQQFVQQQKLRRKHELKPEIPEWLDNWREKPMHFVSGNMRQRHSGSGNGKTLMKYGACIVPEGKN